MINSTYIVIIILTTIIGLASQAYVNSQIKKYSDVGCSLNVSGAQMGQRMLSDKGIYNVPFNQGRESEDHFDPRSNSITLDPHAFNYNSVTAVATACHEAGHACQYAQGYTPMKIRSALVPVVNLSSNAWSLVLIAGIVLNFAGLIDIAIALYFFVVLFQLATLPVEFNASGRALKYLKNEVGLPANEMAGASSVLRACALTYVAAALASLLQLLWLLSLRR